MRHILRLLFWFVVAAACLLCRDILAQDDPSLVPSLIGHTTGFFGTEHCGPKGDATDSSRADPYLNALKNRDVAPDSYTHTTVAAVVADTPDALEEGPIRRDKWKKVKNAQALVPKEAKGIEVIGYLAGVTPEKEESCNCADPNHKDHHMWLVANPGEKQAKSMVVEISPRLLKDHGDWPKLASKAHRDGTQVRIRGWRTFDEEHPEQLHNRKNHAGKILHATRATLWEIHPILEIDVKQGGKWVPIDGGE
jgi:hypothetical protein